MPDLLVTVRSPRQMRNRRNVIRDTWGADFIKQGIEVLFNKPADVVTQGLQPYLVDDMLEMPVANAHHNAGYMTLLTYRWLLANRSWDQVLMIDDDSSVDVARFMEAGWRGTDIWGNNNHYYTAGCCAVYSRKFLLEALPLWSVDDPILGLLASHLGYTRTHSNGAVRPWLPDMANSDGVAVQHYVRNPRDITKNYNEIPKP